jgi:hypothetical protein
VQLLASLKGSNKQLPNLSDCWIDYWIEAMTIETMRFPQDQMVEHFLIPEAKKPVSARILQIY